MYGEISASLNSETLCLTVPITVSNTGSGRIYAIKIGFYLMHYVTSGKVPFAVAPHASKSTTFTLRDSGYTGPGGVCNSFYLIDGGNYWGDPDPSLGEMADTPTNTVSYCIPGHP